MGTWDGNFLQRPNPVSGLQRRTGSYVNEFKGNLQERIVKEHEWETTDPVPQTKHGIHRMGSARAYVTTSGDPDPTTRPTGGGLAAQNLDADDTGRLLVKEGRDLYWWDGVSLAWMKLELTLVGGILLWPSDVIPDNWLLCDGSLVPQATYPDLYSILGNTFGTATASDFYLPDARGVAMMGKGQQDIGGNTKGYTDAIGTKKEDRIQVFTGKLRVLSIFAETPVIVEPEGIFKYGANEGGATRATKSITPSGSTKVIEIDLDNANIRNGSFGHSPVMLLNFIIKAL